MREKAGMQFYTRKSIREPYTHVYLRNKLKCVPCLAWIDVLYSEDLGRKRLAMGT